MVKKRRLSTPEIAKAAKWTDSHLASIGENRESLLRAWLKTPGGMEARADGHPAADPDSCKNDRLFINTVLVGPSPTDEDHIIGLQTFLFGDEGDTLVGAPARAATAKERDGLFGPMSDARLELWRRSQEPILIEQEPEGRNVAIFNDRTVEVGHGVRVLTPGDEGSLFYEDNQKGLRRPGRHERTIAAFWHWTAGFTAKGGFGVLKRRGYPTTFIIGNPSPETGEVTVYQCFDPGKFRGSHGGRWPNRRSFVSGDLVTPAYLKYASRVRTLAGREPPRIRGYRNNGRSWVLGYWLGQIKALLALTTLSAKQAGMNPKIRTGRKALPAFFPSQKTYPAGSLASGDHAAHGNVLTHLEATAKKWDCAGLWECAAVAARLDPEVLACAPWLEANFHLGDPWWDAYEKDARSSWFWPEVFGE